MTNENNSPKWVQNANVDAVFTCANKIVRKLKRLHGKLGTYKQIESSNPEIV